MPTDHLAENAQQMLELVADGFRLFPYPNTATPQPAEWSDFLREHPQYVDGKHKVAAIVFAEDRKVAEAMDENFQRLAGTLIRVMLNDDELAKIHKGTYFN